MLLSPILKEKRDVMVYGITKRVLNYWSSQGRLLKGFWRIKYEI